jgi:hypothetical protein
MESLSGIQCGLNEVHHDLGSARIFRLSPFLKDVEELLGNTTADLWHGAFMRVV